MYRQNQSNSMSDSTAAVNAINQFLLTRPPRPAPVEKEDAEDEESEESEDSDEETAKLNAWIKECPEDSRADPFRQMKEYMKCVRPELVDWKRLGFPCICSAYIDALNDH